MTRVFVCCFLFFLSAGTNFWAALKYPDIEPTIWGFITTGAFLISLFCLQRQKLVVLAAAGSLCTAFLFATESFRDSNMFLDLISNMLYPFYALFIMPLFGLQLLFSFPLASFAGLCAGCYFILYILHLLLIWGSNKQAGL